MDQAAIRDQLADAYAAGALGPGLSLLAETQALLSAGAGARVAIAEAAAGEFLEREAPTPLKADALERVFARIARAEEQASTIEARAARHAFAAEMHLLPAPVRAAAEAALSKQSWQFGGPGLRILSLDLGDQARCELIRIEPGFAAPRHTHEGEEFTLVLTGSFHDHRGRYGVGEIAVAGPGITHRPQADEGEICYNLAVSEAPLVFTGLLGALQKLTKH
ncbi:MAG: ChrR family anti-sigma-E factor [Hyphomonadaceae bacterium]